MNVLIVRLGALGDVVHTIPAAAALRAAFPAAAIHWLVDAKHRAIVDLVPVVDRTIALEAPTLAAWTKTVRELRVTPYDMAIDFQGLLKSAILARASGAARVAGFSIWHLREKTARPFYSDVRAAEGGHVVRKNLRLLAAAGIAAADEAPPEFPIAQVASRAYEVVRARLKDRPYAVINAGAAWPNKRWPPAQFGEVAAFLREACGVVPVVIWGPGEEATAAAVVQASGGAAELAPATGLSDLVVLARGAVLVLSGDTGPLHIAVAVGTPTVSIFGPTSPERNGPLCAGDIVVSRFAACGCSYDRRCRRAAWCLADVGVAEVCAAVQQRLAAARTDRG
ncbi:MAG TPA: glycosyltransferase family 9 protein [Vicinamibacterales bacterium]|jgi:lipopolysaccharide heptosyltransferase I